MTDHTNEKAQNIFGRITTAEGRRGTRETVPVEGRASRQPNDRDRFVGVHRQALSPGKTTSDE